MSEHEKSNYTLERLAKITKTVGEIVLFIGATSYVLGVIVVSIYLVKYNAPAISLFKINYVLTGMWAIILLLPWVIIICPTAHLIYLVKSIKLWWVWRRLIFICALLLLICAYVWAFWRLKKYLFIDTGFEWETYVVTLGTGLLVFVILLRASNIMDNLPNGSSRF